jgi:transposase
VNPGNQGQEAAYSRRYARAVAARHHSFRRCSGSRRGNLIAGDAVRSVSFVSRKLFADSAYQGPIFANALATILPRIETEILKRSDPAKRFVKLPKRWIVERIAWLNRCRRLARDWENLNRTALAFLKLASIRLMLRSSVIQHKVSGQTLRLP